MLRFVLESEGIGSASNTNARNQPTNEGRTVSTIPLTKHLASFHSKSKELFSEMIDFLIVLLNE